jgi:hypothetical protein
MSTFLPKFFFSWLFLSGSLAIASPYDDMIENEKSSFETETFSEGMASGIAALSIGFYGYYYDDRGVALRVAYAATQTIGVLLIGDAIYKANRPSRILITDKHLRLIEKGHGTVEQLRIDLAEAHRQDLTAKRKKLAYSSAILSALYLINARNEDSENSTIRNVYYFFSFNAALVSVSNFYDIYFDKEFSFLIAPMKENDADIGLLATITVPI